MNSKLHFLLLVAFLCNQTLHLLVSARSPPYFGPNDRSAIVARAPSRSTANANTGGGGPLRVQKTLDIFLLYLLPLKAQTVLKSVQASCATALTPLIDQCYADYELESRYTIQLRGTAEELKVGCCNLWKYHSCVVGAIERLAAISFAHCTEGDAEAAEEVLAHSESIPRSSLMCADYHRQSFFCAAYFEPSLALTLVLVLGFVAILVAAALAGFMFYLSTLRVPQIIYVKGNTNNSGYSDAVELIEKKQNGRYEI